MAEIWGTALLGVSAAVSAGVAVKGMSDAKKARKRNEGTLTAAGEAGAFSPLAIPKPVEMDVPSAGEILASWRGEVTTNLPEYEKIGTGLNISEQEAARVANIKANPQYYGTLNQITTNALQAGRGVIPKDVQQNVLRSANEDAYLRGFSYGGPGGRGGNVYAGGNDAAANLALRNLGLTSLDMMKYGDALGGAALEQSRAGRGKIISAKDVVPTPQIFQDQMNASALAEYNFASDKSSYAAASQNAPIQAAYNKLALQMGVQGQSDALAAQTSSQNMQLAMSALQAMGKAYGGSATIGGQTAATGNGAVANWQSGTPSRPYDSNAFLNNYEVPTVIPLNSQTYQPLSSAGTITAAGYKGYS
jgi:hypothetical protein